MNLNKYLFLDVDGVLNSWDFTTYARDNVLPESSLIDPRAVKQLRRIYDATACIIVLSSTWRVGSHDSYKTDLHRADYPIHDIPIEHITPIGSGITLSTGAYKNCPRGVEIEEWLSDTIGFNSTIEPDDSLEMMCIASKLYNYCILDDDINMMYYQRHNFIRTSMLHGLTEDIASRVITLLNRPYWTLPHNI